MAIAGFCGESSLESLTPDEVDVGSLLKAMAVGGSGAVTTLRGSGAAMGGCDGAAVAGAGTAFVVALDGRIDNHETLRQALPGAGGAVPSGAALLLAAYQRWGEDFPDRVVGDFACAIWDREARRLILCCDALGMKPLHFWSGKDAVLFASEPRGLLAHPDVPKAIDEAGFAALLVPLPQSGTSTPYREIGQVPGGHILIFENGRMRSQRYWRPENLPTLRLPRNQDYAEALRTALEGAVRCRLPSTGKVGCFLSAGLDSSGNAAIAARLLAAQGRSLTAFTAVPPPGFPARSPRSIGDEGPLAATLARRHPNIDHVLVRNDAVTVIDACERFGWAFDLPRINPCNARWCVGIADQARRRGIATMLDGVGGNLTSSYDGMTLPTSLLRRGRLWPLARTLWALRRDGHSWLGLLNRTFAPFLSDDFRSAIRKLCGRNAEVGLYDHSAVNPDLARDSGVEEQRRLAGNLAFATTDSRKFRLLVFRRWKLALGQAGMKRLFGCEVPVPQMDRRLVELCLSIPDEQCLLDGEPRSLIRRALADLVPPEILNERRRGAQSIDWFQAYTESRAGFVEEIERLEKSALARRCLDLRRLRRLVDNWPTRIEPGSAEEYHYRILLGRGIGFGRFIRRIEGGNG